MNKPTLLFAAGLFMLCSFNMPETLVKQNRINQYKSNMKKENYSYSFTSPKTAHEIFEQLLNIEQWWSGLYQEAISGESHKLNDEFTFKAGGGMHYSKQKLVELIPDKRVVWLVTDSHLSFLNNPSEWNNSKIRFDLAADGKTTTVTFTHEGLVPQIECYKNCSSAWTSYMNNLKKALN